MRYGDVVAVHEKCPGNRTFRTFSVLVGRSSYKPDIYPDILPGHSGHSGHFHPSDTPDKNSPIGGFVRGEVAMSGYFFS
jgi:hypothetical protein